ncbi:IclR family transcriptional regulator C-terminal domain-containing protein [Brevibacillus parabrevis]|uniref:IclR family transcriptional regulator domain-containing protein n=1 Tax=Brevibacillus parabrevis TaxID=54914 RepID=UPI002E1B4831|nr:IclR family transcriptional regulator C-terminal domain-containing protein [Brevibacillus parabrevis]
MCIFAKPDVLAIACPLFHYDGHVIGSLPISGPIYRMSEEKKAECLEILMRGKREVDEIIQNYRVDLSRYYLFG